MCYPGIAVTSRNIHTAYWAKALSGAVLQCEYILQQQTIYKKEEKESFKCTKAEAGCRSLLVI